MTRTGKTMSTKKLLPPVHPGEILREEYMKPFELSANALARAIGVTPARVNEIANEQRLRGTSELMRRAGSTCRPITTWNVLGVI